MPMIDRENLHKHHRRRVKERFLADGLERFSPHEVLELVLFYAVPQKDTNELGHRLIERFGSIDRVFSASYEDLCEVPGMGDHAATLLHLFLPASAYIVAQGLSEPVGGFDTVDKVGNYLTKRYMGVRDETVFLMLLDNSYALIDCVRVHEGAVNSGSLTPRRLLEIAFRQQAAMAVLAHNHPGGVALPSYEDLCTTHVLRDAFTAVGVTLLEHILVAGETYTPLIWHERQEHPIAEEQAAFYANYTWKGESK